MLATLKFVQGAIAKKDLSPCLTHFHIKNGRITGFNGAIALSSPIALDIEANPRAVSLVKAIQTCDGDTIAISTTKAGSLTIKSGNFKAFIECTTDEYPETEPEGEYSELDPSFINVVKELTPFMGKDASRAWSAGILFKGQSAFATNNIIVLEKWMPAPFPAVVNIPGHTVKELLRIKAAPVGVQHTADTITFHYEDGRWLKSNLFPSEWPDLAEILSAPSNPVEFPAGLFDALAKLIPFADFTAKVIFKEGVLTTTGVEGMGAEVELEGLPDQGVYNMNLLSSLVSVATTVDFSLYPSPIIFYGDNLRGAMVGMSDNG